MNILWLGISRKAAAELSTVIIVPSWPRWLLLFMPWQDFVLFCFSVISSSTRQPSDILTSEFAWQRRDDDQVESAGRALKCSLHIHNPSTWTWHNRWTKSFHFYTLITAKDIKFPLSVCDHLFWNCFHHHFMRRVPFIWHQQHPYRT